VHGLVCRGPTFTADVASALSSAAATALEESGGYCEAISSVGAQIRNPGSSDANMSKHAVNRLIEFIVLGSFCFIDMSCRLIRALGSLATCRDVPSGGPARFDPVGFPVLSSRNFVTPSGSLRLCR
jgi:hypothetical protein